jgi:hypothetical protein
LNLEKKKKSLRIERSYPDVNKKKNKKLFKKKI